MAWNKLKNQNLVIGQKIQVNAPGTIVSDESVVDNTETGNSKTTVLVQQPSFNAIYHTVKKGEYLSVVARTYSVSTDELISWNSLETNNLLVGQKLRVNAPDSGTREKTVAQANPAKESPTRAEDDLKMVFYTVKSGDTLWSISQKYDGVTIDQLKEWNKITGKTGLKVGQKIKVILPGG